MAEEVPIFHREPPVAPRHLAGGGPLAAVHCCWRGGRGRRRWLRGGDGEGAGEIADVVVLGVHAVGGDAVGAADPLGRIRARRVAAVLEAQEAVVEVAPVVAGGEAAAVGKFEPAGAGGGLLRDAVGGRGGRRVGLLEAHVAVGWLHPEDFAFYFQWAAGG